MDHAFDSEESSSGCESGWTGYLEQSIAVGDHKHAAAAAAANEHDQEHDEYDDGDDHDDMSMVSDASSGPPHFQEHQEHDEDDGDDVNGGFCDPILRFRKRRKVVKQTSYYSHRHMQNLPDSLDDTASSPFFSFYDKDLKVCNKEGLMEDDNSFDYSQGHSTTYFEMV